ncbi:MAG: alpha/beta hydrolase [Pseudomonadota bacterium]
MTLAIFEGVEGNRLVATRYGLGNGPPIILSHGGGQTRHAWDTTGARLADTGYTVFAYDHRGHGESDWVVSKKYRFDDFARDQIAIAESVLVETGKHPVIVGASLGGISAMLASSHGKADLFSAFVMVDITPWMDLNGVSRIQGFMRERMHEGFQSLDEAADAIAQYLPHRARPKSMNGLAKNLRLGDDGRYRWHWDPATLDGPSPYDTDPDDLIQRMETGAKLMAAPTLLLRGKRSELITLDHVRDFQTLVPHAEFVDIGGAGHMIAGDDNDVFSASLIAFLERAIPVKHSLAQKK